MTERQTGQLQTLPEQHTEFVFTLSGGDWWLPALAVLALLVAGGFWWWRRRR